MLAKLAKEKTMSDNKHKPQSGRNVNEAECPDSEHIRFTRTVPGHNQGDTAVISASRARAYVAAGDAELLPYPKNEDLANGKRNSTCK